MKRPRGSSPPTVATLTIHEIAPGGDGVGHLEGPSRRAVFVPGVVAGDEVRVAVEEGKPLRGRVLEVLRPGPHRVEAPCAVAHRCGGCNWMPMGRDARLHLYEDHLRRALPAAFADTPVVVHPLPSSGLGRRVRARVHVRASGGRAVVGMRAPRRRDPVEVDTCVILHPRLEDARRRLGPLLDGAHGEGDASLALGRGDAPPVLELRWSGPLPAACFGRFEVGVARGEWSGLRAFQGESPRPIVVGDPTPWMKGADGRDLRLAPGGFGQATEEGNDILAGRVRDLASSSPVSSVVELYAGAGNLTVLLAALAADVVAVEEHEGACEAARTNLKDRGLTARVVQGDAAAHRWKAGTHLLVLDPPRTGAREVAQQLLAVSVRRVLYVSCDASTLGRDLTALAPRYELMALEAVEMFPFTSHVEAIALLEARPRGGSPGLP